VPDLPNVTIVVCTFLDVCGLCGGDGSSCKGCDGIVNSGLVAGVDCETGEEACPGVNEADCPIPVEAVITASVIGGAVASASLVSLAALAALCLLAILRKGYFQESVVGAYDDIIDQQLTLLEGNPLYQTDFVEYQVQLDDVDLLSQP